MMACSPRRSLFSGFGLALLVLWLVAFSSPALADQNDPRLDRLFGELLTTDDFPKALGLIGDIWEIWVENEDATISELMVDGMNAMQVGDWRRALIAFDQVVDVAPEFAEGWNKRATVYFYAGRLDESLEDVKRTLELEPRHFGALSGRGLIYIEKGDLPNALEAFEHALDTNPHMPNIERRVEALRDEIEGNAI